MGESGQPRIFLCHAKEEVPRVMGLYGRLKEAGYDAWLDKVDVLPDLRLPGGAWRVIHGQ
jgi:hypothetical protein